MVESPVSSLLMGDGEILQQIAVIPIDGESDIGAITVGCDLKTGAQHILGLTTLRRFATLHTAGNTVALPADRNTVIVADLAVPRLPAPADIRSQADRTAHEREIFRQRF